MENLLAEYKAFIAEHQAQYQKLKTLEEQCSIARSTIERVTRDLEILVKDTRKIVGLYDVGRTA